MTIRRTTRESTRRTTRQAAREQRRATRAERDRLARELASFSTTAERQELLAILARHDDAEAEPVRALVAA